MQIRSGPRTGYSVWRREARILLRTLRQGALDVVFQPIVDVATGLTAGVEALARPRNGTGFRSAQAFFNAAEASGRASEADRLAHRRALRAWRGLPWPGALFLNCAPGALIEPGTIERLARRAERFGLSPKQIVLEVTERQSWADEVALAAAIAKAHAHGFQIALDDVGAGWSGLSRILMLRPEWIKLDRSFVQSLPHDGMCRHLVRGLVQFGLDAGIRIIAEGVETRPELHAAIEAGVTHVQGYLLARPNGTPATPDESIITSMRAWRIANAA